MVRESSGWFLWTLKFWLVVREGQKLEEEGGGELPVQKYAAGRFKDSILKGI